MMLVKGILIDPFACTVTEVELDGGEIDQYYPLISHETHKVRIFTTATAPVFEPGDAVFVDDEGLHKGVERYFMLPGMPHPLAGKGLILGSDNVGRTTTALTPIFKIEATALFFDRIGDELMQTTIPWEKTE